MTLRLPRRAVVAAALTLGPAAVHGQILESSSVRAAPQALRLEFDQSRRTVTEFAVPIAFTLPVTSRLSFDVGTAYASTTVEVDGVEASSISGVTDTQLRGSYVFGDQRFVLTGGVNLPTGQYEVPLDQAEAASIIGNDFFTFPVSSYGTGFVGTAGFVAALPLNDTWGLAIGASHRVSGEFDAFSDADDRIRFEPAQETRLRAGLEGQLGAARVQVAGVFSTFGNDLVDRIAYKTGDRFVLQGGVSAPVGGGDFYLTGWGLFRGESQQVGGNAPPENIFNAQLGYGFSVGSLYVEPNVESRFWSVDGERAGLLSYAGLRTRIPIGAFDFFPSFSYGVGDLTERSGAADDLTSWRAGLVVRIGR
jgi:hypothetical protein